MATGIYIDGLNLYYGALRNTNYKWLDLQQLARTLLPKDEIKIIRYFTARVNARPGDPQAPARQDTYLQALATSPNVQVHQGRFTSRSKLMLLADHEMRSIKFARVLVDEEKGSDVSLGVHLLNDSARGFVDKAVVISNDSDIAEAIVLAKAFDVPVGIVNPHKKPTSHHLLMVSTFEIHFRPEVLKKCQFPETILDFEGHEVHKPDSWG